MKDDGVNFANFQFLAGLSLGLLLCVAVVIYTLFAKSKAALVRIKDAQTAKERLVAKQDELDAGLSKLADLAEEFDGYRANADSEFATLQREFLQTGQTLRSSVEQEKTSALSSCASVADGVQTLLGAVKTFERWHTDMNTLIKHNRHMHAMNEDFAAIVRQMVVVTLNASIEAARAGSFGRGFSEVAKELRHLATRAENLSNDYRRNLYENDLITTITFQDLQAGGKMIIGSVVTLGLSNDKTKESLGV